MLIPPRYGEASLADVVPSLLAALGVLGELDRLGLGLTGVRRVCLLVIDGLGSQLLAAHPGAAPFLTSLTGPVLTAGFPSTTATSLSSLGTGLPPGEHGLVGYLIGLPGQDRALNTLAWRLHGPGPRVDMLHELVPEQFQPTPTAFERAVSAGIRVVRLGPAQHAASGLSRASLRGGQFRTTYSLGDLAASAGAALRESSRALVYAYHGDLDITGHVRGPAAPAWAMELANVDRLAAAIAEQLPPDGALVITADHGMVQVADLIDLDRTPELSSGVRLIGGEPRARQVYAVEGAAGDVLDTWREVLGEQYAVLSRADAITAGWFGPRVTAFVRPRIGDVLAVPRGAGALIRSGAEPSQSALLGHHGSLTAAELLVPALVVAG